VPGGPFSIKVCSKFFNQGLIENEKSKSAEKFSIKVWLIRIGFSIAIVIAFEKYFSGSDFDPEIADRFFRNGFWSGSWSRLQLQNRWSILKCKPRIDFEIKIADRFSYKNREPILGSVCTWDPQTVFQSLIDFKRKFADRFWSGNRGSISIWKSISDFSGTVFDRDRDHDFDLEIADRFENWLPVQS